MLGLHHKPTLTQKKTTTLMLKVFNVGFNLTSLYIHEKESFAMLGLHNKPNNALSKVFDVYFNVPCQKQTNTDLPILLYTERCLMLGLLDKPTLTPKVSLLTLMLFLKQTKTDNHSQVFNVGFNPTTLHLHENLKVSNVGFAQKTNTDTKNLQYSTKSLQCWLQCSIPKVFNADFNSLVLLLLPPVRVSKELGCTVVTL